MTKAAAVLGMVTLSMFANGCANTVEDVSRGRSGIAGDQSDDTIAPNDPQNNGGGEAVKGTSCQGQTLKPGSLPSDVARMPTQGCTSPAGTYTALSDKAEQQRIAGDVWNLLTNQRCWYQRGQTLNYVFWDDNGPQFKYAGMVDTMFGPVRVESVGRFENLNAAVIRLQHPEDDVYMLVMLDPTHFALGYVFRGEVNVMYYDAVGDGSQCR